MRQQPRKSSAPVRRLSFVALAATMILTACSGAGGTPSSGAPSGDPTGATTQPGGDGPTLVTMRHSWIPDQIMLPYETAILNGYYADEGIRLVDQPGNGGATALQLVANGTVDFGTGETVHILNAISKGITDVVSVMQQYQAQPAGVVVKKDSGINDWKDFVGKKVGGTLGSSGVYGFQAALKLQGVDPESVEFVNYSAGAQFAALDANQIDGAITTLGNVAGLSFKDDLRPFAYADAGYIAPSTALFVRRDFLENNKDLVTRFVRATIKGMQATIGDPEAAATNMATLFNGINPETLAAQWQLEQQFMVNEWTDEHGIGYSNAEAWQFQVDTLVGLEQLPQVDPTIGWTNDIIDAIPIEERRSS